MKKLSKKEQQSIHGGAVDPACKQACKLALADCTANVGGTGCNADFIECMALCYYWAGG
jgi:hypothetical protein